MERTKKRVENSLVKIDKVYRKTFDTLDKMNEWIEYRDCNVKVINVQEKTKVNGDLYFILFYGRIQK